MAICGRCGRHTESAGELCLYCSEYASATSPVGAYSGSAWRARPLPATDRGGSRADSYSAAKPGRNEKAEPEFAALPHFERPFAAASTVWPDVLELAPPPDSVGERDIDLAASRPEQGDLDQRDLEQLDLEQLDLEAQALPGPDAAADGTVDAGTQPDQPVAIPERGRWLTLTVAMAVLLVAAASAVTLVVRHDQASQSALVNKPRVTARPSRPAPPTALTTGQSRLVVAAAAATAPDEAAITASLNRYFNAINSHNYLVYKRTFILALRSGISRTSFSAEFGTTTEANEQLRSITVIGGSKADALVTFVSQQRTPGQPGNTTCTAWSVEFVLSRRGVRYLLIAPPQWHQASSSSCP